MMNKIFERISYHAVYDATILDALQFALDQGFTGIQVADETPHLSVERLSAQQIETIAAFCTHHGLRLVLHAPDEAVSLYRCSRVLQQGLRDYFQALFSCAKHLGVHLITLHVGEMTVFPTDTEPEERLPSQDLPLYTQAARENLAHIIDLADGRFTLCVENYRWHPAVQELLVPFLEQQQVALCWDVAKNTPAAETFFLQYVEHVKQVHLHDCRQVGTKVKGHRVIGSGMIDFQRFLGHLQHHDVLDYCIEVRPREKAKESVLALERLLGNHSK